MDTFLEAEKRTIMAKDNKNKQFTELSDEDLKQVTGGAGIDCSLPENKDKFQCSDKFERKTLTFQGGNWGETWSVNHREVLFDDHRD